MAKPVRSIRGESLEELIKKAEKLPNKPVGTICEMIRTPKAPPASSQHSKGIKIRKELWVVCVGECKTSGTRCTLGVTAVDDSLRLSCKCF